MALLRWVHSCLKKIPVSRDCEVLVWTVQKLTVQITKCGTIRAGLFRWGLFYAQRILLWWKTKQDIFLIDLSLSYKELNLFKLLNFMWKFDHENWEFLFWPCKYYVPLWKWSLSNFRSVTGTVLWQWSWSVHHQCVKQLLAHHHHHYYYHWLLFLISWMKNLPIGVLRSS